VVPGLPPFTLRTHRQERVGTILSKSCSRLDVQNAHLVFGAKALKDMDRIDELSINDGSTIFLLWRLWGGAKTPQKVKTNAKKLEIEDDTVSSIDHDIYERLKKKSFKMEFFPNKRKILLLLLDESSDSAIHTVYERIKGIKGYKMT